MAAADSQMHPLPGKQTRSRYNCGQEVMLVAMKGRTSLANMTRHGMGRVFVTLGAVVTAVTSLSPHSAGICRDSSSGHSRYAASRANLNQSLHAG